MPAPYPVSAQHKYAGRRRFNALLAVNTELQSRNETAELNADYRPVLRCYLGLIGETAYSTGQYLQKVPKDLINDILSDGELTETTAARLDKIKKDFETMRKAKTSTSKTTTTKTTTPEPIQTPFTRTFGGQTAELSYIITIDPALLSRTLPTDTRRDNFNRIKDKCSALPVHSRQWDSMTKHWYAGDDAVRVIDAAILSGDTDLGYVSMSGWSGYDARRRANEEAEANEIAPAKPPMENQTNSPAPSAPAPMGTEPAGVSTYPLSGLDWDTCTVEDIAAHYAGYIEHLAQPVQPAPLNPLASLDEIARYQVETDAYNAAYSEYTKAITPCANAYQQEVQRYHMYHHQKQVQAEIAAEEARQEAKRKEEAERARKAEEARQKAEAEAMARATGGQRMALDAIAQWRAEASKIGESDGITLPTQDPRYIAPDSLITLWHALAYQMAQNGMASNTLLFGPKGTGKSTAAEQFAAFLGIRYCEVATYLYRTPRDLYAMRDISGTNSNTVWTLSALTRAIEAGYCVINVDELNRTSPETLNGLLSLLDHRRRVHVDGIGTIKCGHCVFFTTSANEGAVYTGTNKLDEAINSRFGIRYQLDRPTQSGYTTMLLSRRGMATTTGNMPKVNPDKLVPAHTPDKYLPIAEMIAEISAKLDTESDKGINGEIGNEGLGFRNADEAMEHCIISGADSLEYTIATRFPLGMAGKSPRVTVRSIIANVYSNYAARLTK